MTDEQAQQEPSPGIKSQPGVATEIVKGIRGMVLAAMKGSSGPVKVAVVALVAIASIGLVGAIILAKIESLYALYVILSCLVALLVAAVLIIGSLCRFAAERSPLRSDEAEVTIEPSWERLVPHLPIREVALNEMSERLEGIRDAAVIYIQTKLKHGDVDPKSVRVNIFLPDTNNLSAEGVCELCIPKKLHVGMEADDADDEKERKRAEREREIRFWPNHGITGVVFVEQKAQPAIAEQASSGTYEWPAKFQLTQRQRDTIHPDLRWIASFPMKTERDGATRTMGVLNVDGIGFDLGNTEVQGLIGKLIEKIGPISGLLGKEPMQNLIIYLEDA